MARARYFNNAFTYLGRAVEIIPFATVTLYVNGSVVDALPDTIYEEAVGVGTKTNPFTASANGDIEFYLDVAKYVTVKLTGTGLGEIFMDFQPVLPDPSEILLNIEEESPYLWIMDYSGGAAIDNGVVSATAAFAAAIADAESTGKILFLSPGTYLAKIIYRDNVHIIGSGEENTIIKRPSGQVGSYNPSLDYSTIDMFGYSNTRLSGLTIDGNYTANADAVGGTSKDELTVGGPFGTHDQYISDVTFKNYNFGAGTVGGLRTTYRNIKMFGVTPLITTYQPEFTDSSFTVVASRNWGSYWGLHASGFDYAKDIILENCYAESLRISGFVPGGLNVRLVNITTRDCHRGKSFTTAPYTVGTVSADGIGGGNIAFHMTSTDGVTPSTQRPQNITIDGLQMQFTNGLYASGLELDTIKNLAGSNVVVNNHGGLGLAIANSEGISLSGFISDTCTDGGILIYNSTGIDINGPLLKGTSLRGIHILDGFTGGNSSSYINITDPIVRDCITNITMTATGGNIRIKNPTFIGGDDGYIDDFVTSNNGDFATSIRNSHTSGFGVRVGGGSTTSHFAFYVGNYQNTPLFFVTASIAGSNLSVFNTLNTSAVVRPMVGFYENNIAKAFFGLDEANNPAFVGSDGATELLSVHRTTGLLEGPSLTWTGFTPTLIQGGSAITNTPNCRWIRIGNMLFYRVEVTVTDNTNAIIGNSITIVHNLPAAVRPTVFGGGSHGGQGILYRVGIQWLHFGVILPDSQVMNLMENRANNYVGAFAPTFQLQNNDVISFHGFFEVAP